MRVYFLIAVTIIAAHGAVFQDEVASSARTPRRAPPVRTDGAASSPPIPRRAAASTSSDSSPATFGANSNNARVNAGAGVGEGAFVPPPVQRRNAAAHGITATESKSPMPSTPARNEPARNRAEGAAGNAGMLRGVNDAAFQKQASAPSAVPVLPFHFVDAASARAAAGAAYDALSAAAAANADAEAGAAIGGILVGADLRAWAVSALRAPIGVLEPGTPLGVEFDRLFLRFVSRQGFAPPAGDTRTLPRALVLNNAATAFLLDAANKLRTGHASLISSDAKRAIADLEREHPRSKKGEL